jgi:hypothetical protein
MSIEYRGPRTPPAPRRAELVLIADPDTLFPITLRGDSARGPTMFIPAKAFDAVVRALPDLIRGACLAAK